MNDDIRQMLRESVLSHSTQARLLYRARSGDASARELLIRRNSRLAMGYATHYSEKMRKPLDDMFQEAMCALINVIDTKWDPQKGTLATYADAAMRLQLRRVTLRDNILQPSFREIEGQRPLVQPASVSLDAPLRHERLDGGSVTSVHEIVAAPANTESAAMINLTLEAIARAAQENKITAQQAQILRLRFGLTDEGHCDLKKTARLIFNDDSVANRTIVRKEERSALQTIRELI